MRGPDSGRETLQMQPVNLRDTLQRVVESWQQVASIRSLQFSASIDTSDLFVMGDESVLRRLADILLDSAFKYTPSPGSVHLLLEQKADSAVISVQDSGVGISENEHDKIFERFYCVDKARSRAQGGAGLGLSIAQWIVAQHHGSIAVESHPGDGSLFRIQLPLIAAPVQNPMTPFP
jgi:signal transduction histidine kinase